MSSEKHKLKLFSKLRIRMMNAMSRRPAGPVRQHSLQQPPRRQQQIRRQRSTEDEKNLQMYSSSGAAGRGKYGAGAAGGKCEHHRMHERPKVRVAWGEQPAKPKNDGVEIVARQIPTGRSSRPTTGRGSRGMIGRGVMAEKATILYSRQELAERLRLAWRQREENKSNIDIFLAHNTVEESRCDSGMSSATNRTTASTPKIPSRNEDSSEDNATEEVSRRNIEVEKQVVEKVDERKFQTWFSSFESNESEIKIPVSLADDDAVENNSSEEKEGATEEEEPKDTGTIEKKSSISINCNDWNASVTISAKVEPAPNVPEDPKAQVEPKVPDFTQAKLKRASYQSGMNKAFVTPIAEKPSTPRSGNRPEAGRFRRTSSAPPQQRTQVSIVIDAPGIPMRADADESPPLPAPKTVSRPIKSAPPVKRRSKINKRRGPAMVGSTRDIEDGTEEGRSRTKGVKGGKSNLEAKSTDVVTMVSLVSSADSESEMDENSPRDDKLICELRNKLPTTPIIKSSNGLSGGIRKPFKSVSFQQESFECDSPPLETRASLQARFVALSRTSVTPSPGDTPLLTAATITMSSWRAELTTATTTPAPLPLLPLQPRLPEPPVTEVPLTDREKRCLAVPIGDVYDKKRKLVRCRSAVAAPRHSDAEKPPSESSQACLRSEMRMAQIAPQSHADLRESNNPAKNSEDNIMPTEANLEKVKNLTAEPYCQTPKEKECWHLYRRMCDKGVFVSFDTVLRGMLTPTEYRLRQKEMSQNC